MQPRWKDAPELVWVTLDEETQEDPVAVILGENPAERLWVDLVFVAEEVGADEAAVVEHIDHMRRRIGIIGSVMVGIVGREELGKERDQIDQRDDDGRDDRQSMLAKFPPDELPLRGNEDP